MGLLFRQSASRWFNQWSIVWRWLGRMGALVAMVAIATCASSDLLSSEPASPKEQLAIHLTQSGAVMYATYWCPYCQRQEALFGETAFQYIERVECDPRGDNPQPERCRAAGVRGLPTWIINGQNYPGLRSLAELADLSGYANYEPSEQAHRPD